MYILLISLVFLLSSCSTIPREPKQEQPRLKHITSECYTSQPDYSVYQDDLDSKFRAYCDEEDVDFAEYIGKVQCGPNDKGVKTITVIGCKCKKYGKDMKHRPIRGQIRCLEYF